MNVQEGRRTEYEIAIELIQPWSVPIFKTTLPPDVLQTMIEISDQVIANKEAERVGDSLAGQIEKELKVELNILEQTKVMDFFIGTVREFVIQCKYQMMLDNTIQQEEWLIQMLIMWIVSQQPNEYNPMHVHTECTISSVMYLKVPKMLPSRKESSSTTPNSDGSILFVNSASRDIELCKPDIAFSPQVGDFYIFGAHQGHAVYPYRCEEGQEDVERRSISFNAVFQSRTDYDKGRTQ